MLSTPPPGQAGSAHPTSLEAIVHGGGAIGERLRVHDWAHHPLGDPDRWPQSLKTALRIMLTSRFAMWLGWGSELYFFYNDAYAPTLGIKESWALGTPAAKLWAEVWPAVGPRAESVVRTGTATWDESLLLFLERSGYPEETYHTFSYSPVPDDTGAIGGMLCVVREDTERAIGERRMALLREIASDLAGLSSEARLFEAIPRRLSRRPHDVPFALVYLFQENSGHAFLACSHGIEEQNAALAPQQVNEEDQAQTWPAASILHYAAAIDVDDLTVRFEHLPTRPWDRPPRQALVVPIAQLGAERPAGFLVVGINPYRPLDTDYRGFVELLAGQISTGLSNVRAYEVERRRAESLAELDRAKTAFFGNVSHELRTPLTLLLGPLEDLQPLTESNGSARELVSLAHRNAVRLLKLVNTLLDFARLEAGRMQAVFAPTDLAPFTEELASSFRTAIERAGLRFIVECDPLPEPVYVDRDLWEKIVLNLISNAFKFTMKGEIRVSVRTVGECVEFAVQDTGAGIPADARVHLFERFYRVRGAAARTQEGTGIGLALVNELAKLHGGTLHVDSEPGMGSTFSVLLRRGVDHLPGAQIRPSAAELSVTPSTAPAFAAEVQTWAGAADGSENGTGLEGPLPETATVLVAEDNPDMRRYIARLLAPQYRVIGAGDGEAALALIELHKPNLILSDVMMSRLDGFGLLAAVRSRPELRTIPVILLSARAGEEARVEGLEAGADDYLIKPFSTRELLARVNVHLRMSRIRSISAERERELRTKAEVFATALRESSERLSAALTAAATGTFRWDLRTHSLNIDDPLERLLGVPGAQPVRSLPDLVRLVHPDDRLRVLAGYERCAKEGTDFDMEFRVARADGAVRWLSSKARTFLGENRLPAYMTGACVDITKRKQTEAFVWRQKDVLEQIVAGAPINDVLETLTLDVEQIAGRKIIATVMMVEPDLTLRIVAGRRCPPEWRDVINGQVIGPKAGSCGSSIYRNERVIVSDITASPLWEDYVAEALRHGLRACWSTPIVSSGGKVLGAFAVYYREPASPTAEELRFVDIVTRTAAIVVERERAQQELKESQAQLADYAQSLEQRVQDRTARLQETVSELESFSYSISHDMRAPLRAMQSFAQILAEDCSPQLGPEGKDYIRRIISASDRMDRLIQDVLTYSRVTRTELQLEPVNIEHLLDGILESYPQFHAPHAQVEIHRPLPRVLGNEAALTQCFSNLIGNAIKFVAPDTRPRVEIWGEERDNRARIYVRDNGIGIDRDAHEKIFRIFYQLDRNFEGTGIGLSVVRKAAERMGGSVGLESTPGKGSTFHLELSLAPPEPVPAS